MATVQKMSVRGKNKDLRVDVDSASPMLRRQRDFLFTMPATTQNSTTSSLVQSCGVSGKAGSAVVKVIGATAVWGTTAPAVSGGTCTVVVEKIANDGTTATSLTTATTLLSRTANVPFDLTALATPLTVNGDESIRVSVTTSNNAVGTAGAGGSVTVICAPVEDTTISD